MKENLKEYVRQMVATYRYSLPTYSEYSLIELEGELRGVLFSYHLLESFVDLEKKFSKNIVRFIRHNYSLDEELLNEIEQWSLTI